MMPVYLPHMPWASTSSLVVNNKGSRKEKVEVAIAIRTKYTIRERQTQSKLENKWKEILCKRNVKGETPFLKIKVRKNSECYNKKEKLQ